MKAAFATVGFPPLSDIQVFHTDRGSEFANASIDEMLEVFGIERSLSEKGCPYDNAVIESANNSLKRDSSTASRFPTPSICGRGSTSGCGPATTRGSTRPWAT